MRDAAIFQAIPENKLSSFYVLLVVCDVLSLVGCRSLHVIPKQMSVIAAICKYFIPKELLGVMRHTMPFLGLTHLVRQNEVGILQKIIRDYPVVSFGHSSAVICLNTLMPQVNALLKKDKLTKEAGSYTDTIFNLSKTLPEFNWSGLHMSNSGYLDPLKYMFANLSKYIEKFSADDQVILHPVMSYITSIWEMLKEKKEEIASSIESFDQLTVYYLDQFCRIFVFYMCLGVLASNQSVFNQWPEGLIILMAEEIFSTQFFDCQKNKEKCIAAVINKLKKATAGGLAYTYLKQHYPI